MIKTPQEEEESLYADAMRWVNWMSPLRVFLETTNGHCLLTMMSAPTRHGMGWTVCVSLGHGHDQVPLDKITLWFTSIRFKSFCFWQVSLSLDLTWFTWRHRESIERRLTIVWFNRKWPIVPRLIVTNCYLFFSWLWSSLQTTCIRQQLT